MVSDSVVVIRTEDGLGAGFLVKNSRLIATAFHVIETGGKLTVLARNGREYSAEVYAYDEERDLAILTLDQDLELAQPLPLAGGEPPEVGTDVVMVGHPFGTYAETVKDLEGLLTWTITSGIVGGVSDLFIQTDAASSPGNSGGPILNRQGEVLGVVSRRFEDAEGLTFSVPVVALQRLLDNPGNPEPLRRAPMRRFGVGLGRMSTLEKNSGETLGMDGLFLSWESIPRTHGPRFASSIGYNRIDEVPENSGLFHFSEDLYWLQLDMGVRWQRPEGRGSFDPLLGVRAGVWHRDAVALAATATDPNCDFSSETCALDVKFTDDGSDSGFKAFGVAGLQWSGPVGTFGGGVLLDPFDEPRLRYGFWFSLMQQM